MWWGRPTNTKLACSDKQFGPKHRRGCELNNEFRERTKPAFLSITPSKATESLLYASEKREKAPNCPTLKNLSLKWTPGHTPLQIFYQPMNFPGTMYPGFFVYYPMVMIQQETCTVEPTVMQSPPEIPSPRRHDLANCEQQLRSFLPLVRDLTVSETWLDWENLLPRLNQKTIPSIQEFENIYSGGMERYKAYTNKSKISWGQDDLIVLFWLMERYCQLHTKPPRQLNQADWDYLASMVPFRRAQQCMYKYLSMQKYRLEDYPWDPESEQHLFNLANQQQKKDWVGISRSLHRAFPGVYRSPKQCRQHWSLNLNNFYEKSKYRLNPFRTFWSEQQDLKLIELYMEHGRRWKHISMQLTGRSENAIKNRFSLLWSKYKKRRTTDDVGEIRDNILRRHRKLKSKPSIIKTESTESVTEE